MASHEIWNGSGDYCLKRAFTVTLRTKDGSKIEARNLCLRAYSTSGWKCPRITRDPEDGKKWDACGNTHGEDNVSLGFLVEIGVITSEEYLSYVAKFARANFEEIEEGEDPRPIEGGVTYFTEKGEALLQELFDLFSPEALQLLKGADLKLGKMDWICYACGRLVRYLGLVTHVPIVETPWEEPSTDPQLRAV